MSRTPAVQGADVIVYDGPVAHGQQRLGGGEGERTQAFALAAGHEQGLQRQLGGREVEVDDALEGAVGAQHRQQGDACQAALAHGCHVGPRPAQAAEVAPGGEADGAVEAAAAQQRAAHVAVGEGAAYVPFVVYGKECHGAAAEFVEASERLEQRGLSVYEVAVHKQIL